MSRARVDDKPEAAPHGPSSDAGATWLTETLTTLGSGTWDWDMTTGAVRLGDTWVASLGFAPGALPTAADALAALVHPDDRARGADAVRTLLGGFAVMVEWTGRVRDLHGVWQWRLERARVASRDAAGAPLRVVGLGTSVAAPMPAPDTATGVMDDTASHAYDRLRSSEERFRLVAEATRDVLSDWDIASGVHWWSPNAAALFGHDPGREADIGAWTSRLHPDDRPRVVASLNEALGGTAAAWEDEYRFRIADGSYGEFLDRAHIVRDARGAAVRMIGAMTDVTEVTRAHRSLVETHARLRAVGRDVHLAESRERAALARELHDEFGQLLTAAKLSASWLRAHAPEPAPGRPDTFREKAANVCDVLDMALHGVRHVASQLRPPALDQLGLPRALEGLAASIERHAGFECQVTIDEATRAAVFGPAEGAALYRIAQELLTNAARHAAATTVRVTLTSAGDRVRLDVDDDGRGFVPEAAAASGSLGLKGIRERTELLGGTVAVTSQPGAGTRVRLTLPRGGA